MVKRVVRDGLGRNDMTASLTRRLRSRVSLWLGAVRNSAMARTAIVTGLLTVLCKGIGFAKELLVAAEFGAGATLDSYLIALVLPTMVCNVFALSFASALVMQYLKNKTNFGEEAARERYSTSMFWGIMFVVTVAVISVMLGPVLLPWLSPGFRPNLRAETQHLLWLLFPYSVLTGISTIWSSILCARGRFVASAISPGVISLGLIIMVSVWRVPDARVLVAGLTIGAFVDVLILGICLRHDGLPLRPHVRSWQPEDQWIVSQMLPMIVAASVRSSSAMIDQSMVSMLGEGSVSELNYGSRFVVMAQGLVILPTGKILFPHFVQLVESRKWKSLKGLLRRSVQVMFVISVPMTIILLGFSGPLVQWTFQRGQFTYAMTDRVSAVQMMYALQFPFYLWGVLLARMAVAMRLRRIILWGGALNLLVNIAMNYLLMKPLGVKGIALSTAIVCLGSACYFSTAIHWALRRNIRDQEAKEDSSSEPKATSRCLT